VGAMCISCVEQMVFKQEDRNRVGEYDSRSLFGTSQELHNNRQTYIFSKDL